MRGPVLVFLVIFQAACAAFFLYDILGPVIGIRSQPLRWQMREIIEIGAALGLLLGTGLGAVALRHAHVKRVAAEGQLRIASGAFMEVLEEHFNAWQLTPSERDVALFAIKGFSTAEIARMRAVSEGTVKAQTNAIYRKAGVSGRPQLLSLFIDDLMGDGLAASDD